MSVSGSNTSDDGRWQQLVALLLGPEERPCEDGPSSAELVGGATDPSRRDPRTAAYLLRHPQLRRAIEGGMAVVEALDREEETTAGAGAEPVGEERHRVLEIGAAPLRLAAATEEAEEVPLPADRRVLYEQPGAFRLVYYRHGALARLTLVAIGDEVQPPEEIHCAVDGAAIDPLPVEREPWAMTFDLGPAARLAGCELAVRLRRGGDERRFSWILVTAG